MIKKESPLFPRIESIINELKPETITEERKVFLQPLAEFIQNKVENNLVIIITFICTHNSRRSLLSQVWAQTLAHFYNIKNVFCYSSGTETTALYPMIAETLRNSGFHIQAISNKENPIFSIKYAENEHPIIGFSKIMDSNFNPASKFAAVLTCDSANEACPFVPGAEKRIPITFEDPKAFDNTPQEAEKYMEKSLQIATELMYVFSQIKFKE